VLLVHAAPATASRANGLTHPKDRNAPAHRYTPCPMADATTRAPTGAPDGAPDWATERGPLQIEVRHLPEGARLDWSDGSRSGSATTSGFPVWVDGPAEALAALHEAHSDLDEQLLHDVALALRNPPVDLDALDPELLRHRISEKWSTYEGEDVLACWVAEMDYPVAAPIHAVLERATAMRDFGYPIGLRETGLADVFADRMNERFGWTVEPARCEILSDVVQGMVLAVEAWSASGDGVVVQTPIYPPFLSSVRNAKRRLIENRLVRGADGFEIDFDSLRADTADGARLLLLCNPHNPTGRAFARDELERLAALALERDWVVVSDEIHADLVFDGRVHIPFASLSPEVAQRTVTLTSATKAFNIPGLRTAVAHFGSAPLQQRFNACVPRHARGGIGLLGLYATIAAWRDSQPWLDQVLEHLQANRDYAASFLRARCPGIELVVPEATYLMWLDFSALDLPAAPATTLFERGRIALSAGHHFGPGFEHFARLNFATSRPILREVLERLAAAVEAG